MSVSGPRRTLEKPYFASSIKSAVVSNVTQSEKMFFVMATYQVEVSLKGAELVGPEVLWKYFRSEEGYIDNTEGPS